MSKSMHRGHNSNVRPEEQMSRHRRFYTSVQKRVEKRRSNKKRRQRDGKLIDE